MLLEFIPVALIVTLTPGPATALVIRSALRGGRTHALHVTVGNSIGIFTWAVLSALGVSALVTASEVAYAVLRLVGAAVLISLGVQSLRRSRDGTEQPRDEPRPAPREARDGVRLGLVTGLANPKVAIFFVALFPQFLHRGEDVLPLALAMAAMVVCIDLIYFSLLALAVTRAREAFVAGPWGRRMERVSGAVLIALGLRVAVD